MAWIAACPAAPFREAKAAPKARHAPAGPLAVRCQAAPEQQQQPAAEEGLRRREVLSGALAAAAVATAAQPALPLPAKANRVLSSDWEVVDLPVEKGVVLLDVGFTGTDPNHGGWWAFEEDCRGREGNAERVGVMSGGQ